MKTLTIEHLAAYLPYNPKIIRSGNVVTMTADESDIKGRVTSINSVISDDRIYLTHWKIAARPLSQLTEPITHNGETFVPIEKLHSLCEVDAEIEFLDCIEDDWRCAPDRMKYAPNTLMQIMLSWHFDIFNLGADNLCVYMNNDGTLAK